MIFPIYWSDTRLVRVSLFLYGDTNVNYLLRHLQYADHRGKLVKIDQPFETEKEE